MASAIMSHATRGCWTTSGHSGTITAFSHKLRWPGTTQFHLYLQASHSPSPLHKLQLEWRGSAPGRTSSASSPTCSVATPFASERSRAITKHLQLQLNSEAVELAKHAGHSERGVQVATNGASTGAGTVSWAGELPTTAGGVVIFNIAPDKAFSILITQDTRYPVPKPAAAHGVPARKDLVLHVNGDSAAFYIRESGQEHLLVKVSWPSLSAFGSCASGLGLHAVVMSSPSIAPRCAVHNAMVPMRDQPCVKVVFLLFCSMFVFFSLFLYFVFLFMLLFLFPFFVFLCVPL